MVLRWCSRRARCWFRAFFSDGNGLMHTRGLLSEPVFVRELVRTHHPSINLFLQRVELLVLTARTMTQFWIATLCLGANRRLCVQWLVWLRLIGCFCRCLALGWLSFGRLATRRGSRNQFDALKFTEWISSIITGSQTVSTCLKLLI